MTIRPGFSPPSESRTAPLVKAARRLAQHGQQRGDLLGRCPLPWYGPRQAFLAIGARLAYGGLQPGQLRRLKLAQDENPYIRLPMPALPNSDVPGAAAGREHLTRTGALTPRRQCGRQESKAKRRWTQMHANSRRWQLSRR